MPPDLDSQTPRENWSAALASDRRRALLLGEELPTKTEGVVLVTDVSGYTALTGRLVEASGARRGAETIARHLESTYERLITLVHAAGGSVVAFAGDAFFSYFDAALARDALAAAHALARARLPSAELSVKVGVGAGEVLRLALLERYHIELLSGAAVEAANRAEKLAGPREVIAPTALVEQLASKDASAVSGRPLDEAAEWTRVLGATASPSKERQVGSSSATEGEEALPDSMVAPWVLPPVWAAASSSERPFSELRLGVPLFVRFTELPREPDPRPRLLDLAKAVEDAVLAEGGYVIDAQGGAASLTLYASFGAPVSHEDNPERALRAALALSQRSYPDGVRARAALSIGRVRAGRLGSSQRRVDAVVGRDVNLAARLLAITEPGEVRVSPALVRAARGHFSFQSLGVSALKGIDEPVEVHAATMGGTSDSDRGERRVKSEVGLLGRDHELGLLKSAARDHALGGGGGLVWLSGAPGIGKTRLVGELRGALTHPLVAELGVTVADANTPYGPVRSLLGQLLPRELGTEHLEMLLGDFAPLTPLLAPFLPYLPASGVDTAVQDLKDSVRAENTRHVLRRLIASVVRETRTALVIEDLHWLDTSTSQLLQDLLRLEPDLFVVATSRELPDATWSAVVRQHVELVELSPPAVRALIERLLGRSRVDSAVVDFVLARGKGHPLYTEELVHHLVGTECLDLGRDPVTPKNGTSLDKLEVPATVEGVLMGRIDRLSADQALALEVLSVLGQRILPHTLQAASAHSRALPQRAAELVECGLLEARDGALVFRHALLREVAYAALDSGTRARFHELSARAEASAFDATNDAERLVAAAHHFTSAFRDGKTSAGMRERAALWSARAAAHARRSAAYREAVRAYTDALEIGAAAGGENALTWRLELAESYRLWGKFAEARAELDKLLAELGELPGSAGLGLLRELGQQTLHRSWFEHDGRDVGETERERLLVSGRAHNMLSELAYFGDDKVLSLYAAVRTLNVLEPAGPSPHLSLAFAAMGLLADLFGFGSIASGYWSKATEIAERSGQPHDLADVLRMRGLARMGRGHFPDAERDFDEAEANHRATRDLRHLGDVITMRAMVALFEERYEDALALLGDLDRCVDESDSALHRLWSAVWSGACLSSLGQTEEAERLLGMSVQLAATVGDRQALLGARAQLGLLLRQKGRIEEADLHLEEVERALTAQKGMPNGTAEFLGYKGLFDARLHEMATSPSRQASERLARAARFWAGFSRLFPFAEARSRLAAAEVAKHAGQAAKARREVTRALRAAHEYRMPSVQKALAELSQSVARGP